MSIRKEKDKQFAASSIFPSFFYASLGLVLGQVGAAQMHGSWSLHIFLGAPGIVLLGLVLFRARMHWQAATVDISPLRLQAIGWYLLLIAAGVFIGALVSAGSVLFLGVVPALTYLFPWTRIPVCRARFVVSSLVMLVGAIVWIVIQDRSGQSLYFMIAAWMLYVPSVIMHFLVLVSLDRGYRISVSRTTEILGLEVHGQFPR